MKWFHAKSYRYPRWPLVKNTSACAGWILLGAGIAAAPVGYVRWIGTLPVFYGILHGYFHILPKWQYVIRPQDDALMIGSDFHLWSMFDELRIEKSGQGRSLRLVSSDGKIDDVVIYDDLPGFDELARICFFHINRNPQADQRPDSASEIAK